MKLPIFRKWKEKEDIKEINDKKIESERLRKIMEEHNIG